MNKIIFSEYAFPSLELQQCSICLFQQLWLLLITGSRHLQRYDQIDHWVTKTPTATDKTPLTVFNEA